MDQEINRSSPIRIIISDDHPIVRQGLRTMLEAYPDLEVIVEAEDGEQAVHLANTLQPDVIIIDIVMPTKDGITATREITQLNPDARILVLTSFDDDDKIFEALKAGAHGYHLKESPPGQLVESIRSVHKGEVTFHPTVARKLLQEIKDPRMMLKESESLTMRELDVLRCLAQGLSNQDIATELTVSIRTVTTHIRHILDKLHLANRTQAALYAVERGIHHK